MQIKQFEWTTAHMDTMLTLQTYVGQLQHAVFGGTTRYIQQLSAKLQEHFQHHGQLPPPSAHSNCNGRKIM